MTNQSLHHKSSAVEMPAWVEAVQRKAAESCFSDRFCIESLEVTLNSVDPSLVRWVLKYLQPLSKGSPSSTDEACRFFCLYSDDLVSDAATYFMVEDNITFLGKTKNGSTLKCAEFSNDIVVYCNGPEGIFWLADFGAKTIFVIFSSRTRRPALEFGRTVREVVTGYLTDRGWSLYHAGAVDTSDGALMIVGNPGAGKTSLMLALLSAGARYIANELLFVRVEGDAIRILGYPLVIAVGIGTAMHLPKLRNLITGPDPLLYPRRRFDATRVAKTDPDEWHLLDDKLQLLPEELGTYVDTPGFVPGGKLRAIVVPRLCKRLKKPTTERLDRQSAYEILSDNLLEPQNARSSHMWSGMVVRGDCQVDEEQSLENLADMGAVRFDFNLSSSADSATYTETLHRGMHDGTLS